jgi:iron complex outermembrane receptor protein
VQHASLLITLLGLSCSGLQASSDKSLITEEDLFSELPFTLTATRLSQAIKDSPVSITVIDRDMIEAYDPQELIDVLRLVPGFQVIHPRGHRSSLTYHGVADEYARRMQVLIDGRSVYSPILGHVEWASLDLQVEDIERIEVIRGPNAASHGANSFSAVVNIITRHSADVTGNYVKITGGDIRTRRVMARHSGHGDKYDYRISVGYRSDEGFDSVEWPDDKRIATLSLRSDIQLNTTNSLEVQFGYNDNNHREGNSFDVDVNQPRDVEARSSFELLRWRHQAGSNEEFSLQFYHNRQYIQDDYNTAPIDSILPGFSALAGTTNQPIFLSNSSFLHRYDIEFQHTFTPSDEWRVVWGSSARLDRVGSRFFFNTDSNRDYINNHVYRLFGHTEWRPNDDWTFNAGLMIENNDVSGTDYSPRLAANYHLDAHNTFRISYSRALRTPSVLEYQADASSKLADGRLIDYFFLANKSLEPEKLSSIELGYVGNFRRYGLNIDAKLFYERFSDVIASYSDRNFNDPINALLGLPPQFIRGSVTTSGNNPAATIKGFEAQARYQPTADTRFHLGYTYMKASGRTLKFINGGPLGLDTAYNDTNKEVPRTIGTLQVIHELGPDIQLSMALHRYSLYSPKGGDDTGDFSILNWRIAKKFNTSNGKGQIAANFQNISDEYFDFADEQVFNNRIFFSLEYELE